MANETLRSDKRTNSQIRPISSVLSSLNRADGSASFSFGNSSVLCSVYGPQEVKIKDELLDRATIDVNIKPQIGNGSTTEKNMERIVREAYSDVIIASLHPRTSISITVQITQDDGSMISTIINAVTLALIDAGIPLHSTLLSVTSAVMENGEILIDPTNEEMKEATSVHVFAFSNTSNDIVSSESTGTFTEDEYFKCFDICKLAVSSVLKFVHTAIERKLQKEQKN
ncbi:ribosomal protein S5 domain 2-type protein [Neocallimastix lanati (nom. inval.)]|uniref:Ribosomal protein S5 domain 2-like protein n=1 Tax=Neocallimastix californiae TaxID=1754190 RepID=A0A1Y2CFJ0_9FUNG|nr:ribosomal protein S5 domain 2-type protein [Neocallimastix sp. JGI-2020a]ORY45799.1 ribosomal protein S5 domain 2-like protein [Neocallimastix californiae]|eukprot:ORY45799.1 ribosomal protein S5 domain 2-like protein [Neocallimastix californiae]